MPWYVVQTNFKEEERALTNLKRQKYRTYCPMLSGRPLFSGYVFVQFNPRRKKWRSIGGTLGCKRLLGVDPEKPCPISSAMINAMKAQEAELGEVRLERMEYTIGDRLKLLSGPLAGHIGELVKTSKGRVQLLLHILGGRNVVYSSITNVELAE